MTQTLTGRTQVRPAMIAAVAVAMIATGSAYLAMVGFGTDVLEQSVAIAYTTAGVFELSLVTVALLAREAATQNRPNGTLLTLTWALSSASGVFAAWHELFLGHAVGAVVFRFVVPVLAALMWHLALIGDRHLASGRTWSAMRENARMHALFLSIDAERRARNRADGSRSARRRIDRAERARLRARAVALRTVPPAEVRAQVATWSDALAAVDEVTAEAVALADEDAARMTIRADLSAHHDRTITEQPSELALENEHASKSSEPTSGTGSPAARVPAERRTSERNEHRENSETVGERAERAPEPSVPSASNERPEQQLANIALEQAERASASAPSARPSQPLVPLVPRGTHGTSERRSARSQRGRALTPDEVVEHDMMRAAGIKVEEIAARLGFRDRNALYRAYKKATGETTHTPAYGTQQAPARATIDPIENSTVYATAAPGNQRNDD